ncbi:hypothetical protein VTN00DRAFT_5856 [Thermoascus crustaceus]|uniref:uncharacterized protein n=1 Tax=Thermoascus crustaceus TaxID=5088 RepID=UPI00374362E3
MTMGAGDLDCGRGPKAGRQLVEGAALHVVASAAAPLGERRDARPTDGSKAFSPQLTGVCVVCRPLRDPEAFPGHQAALGGFRDPLHTIPHPQRRVRLLPCRCSSISLLSPPWVLAQPASDLRLGRHLARTNQEICLSSPLSCLAIRCTAADANKCLIKPSLRFAPGTKDGLCFWTSTLPVGCSDPARDTPFYDGVLRVYGESTSMSRGGGNSGCNGTVNDTCLMHGSFGEHTMPRWRPSWNVASTNRCVLQHMPKEMDVDMLRETLREWTDDGRQRRAGKHDSP